MAGELVIAGRMKCLASLVSRERELNRAVARLSYSVVQLWVRGPARSGSGDALARALVVQAELEVLRGELLKELALRRDEKSAIGWRRRLCYYLNFTLLLLHCRVLAFIEAGVYRAVKALLTQTLTRHTPRISTKEILNAATSFSASTGSSPFLPQSAAFASLGALQAILDYSSSSTAEALHAEILHLPTKRSLGEAQVIMSPRRLPLERQRRQWRRAQAALLVMSAAAAGQPTPKDHFPLSQLEVEKWTIRGRRGGGGGCGVKSLLLFLSCNVVPRGGGSGSAKVQADVTLDFEEDVTW